MFSQTIEYALRAMTHLASVGDAVSNEKIAAQTRVPPGYLWKVMRDLVVAGLVTSSRGPGGGFELARQPKDISILDVVNAVDPITRIDRCPLGRPEHTKLCKLHQRLDDTLAAIERTLRGSTLAELLEEDQGPSRCGALLQTPTVNGHGAGPAGGRAAGAGVGS